ncbi:MAG: F0F1 ATP synthase subunit B [Candidatus Omnitrophica bacterium]|nr:F0F1 ATP synthase subunit B [Candidatus Omnitrophota bacterium]
MEILKLLNANEIIAQILSFFLVLWLLRSLMWKRLLGLLDQRKEKIASEYKKIEEAKEAAAHSKAIYDHKIADIHLEAQKKIHEAMAEGRNITDSMRKKAQQDAQEIINNAKANMSYELLQAKEKLKEELIDITLKAAEKLIEEKFTEANDRKMVEDFIIELEKKND